MTNETETTEVESQETPAPEGDSETTSEPQENSDSAVKKLRDENAKRRVSQREAEEKATAAEQRSQRLALSLYAATALRDPLSLPWQPEFSGGDGEPDREAIVAAAEALALQRPDLSKPRGDVGSGFRDSDTGSVDLAGMLRAGA